MHAVIPASIRRRLDPEQRYGLRLTLLAVAFVLVAVPFGILLEQVLAEGPVTDIDLWLSVRLIELAEDHEAVRLVLEWISFVGKPIVLVFVVGIPAIWLFFRGEKKLTVYLAVTAIVGGLVDTAIKLAVGRPRPSFGGEPLSTAFGTSFPSGHALSSVVCYGAVLLVMVPYVPARWRRPVIAITALLVLAIGLSRLGLGMHFTSDVIAGYVLGIAWLMASTAAFSIWRVERGGEPVAATTDGIEPEHDPELVHAHDAAGDVG